MPRRWSWRAPLLRRACRVGAGVVVCPGVEIGEEAFVAAGAVVVADVPPRGVVMGVPARSVREVPDEDLLERWREDRGRSDDERPALRHRRPPCEPLLDEMAARQRRCCARAATSSAPRSRPSRRSSPPALGSRHCVGVANGTDALTIALRALGVGPGDEVVVPALTFYATAEAVINAGATPVLCDVDEDDLHDDRGDRRAGDRRAHQGVDPGPPLRQPGADGGAARACRGAWASSPAEDAAQAAGAKLDGEAAGALADAATFSFFPSKNLGGFGDGGAILTDDDEVAAVRPPAPFPRLRWRRPAHRGRLQLPPRRAAGGGAAGPPAAPPGLDRGAPPRRRRLRGRRPRGDGDAPGRDRGRGVLLPPLRGARARPRSPGGAAGGGRHRRPRLLLDPPAPPAGDAASSPRRSRCRASRRPLPHRWRCRWARP